MKAKKQTRQGNPYQKLPAQQDATTTTEPLNFESFSESDAETYLRAHLARSLSLRFAASSPRRNAGTVTKSDNPSLNLVCDPDVLDKSALVKTIKLDDADERKLLGPKALATRNSENMVEEAPLIRLSLPRNEVVDAVLAAAGHEGVDFCDQKLEVSDDSTLGVMKEPILREIYQCLPVEKRSVISFLAREYACPTCKEMFKGSDIVVHVQSHFDWQPPPIMMSPETFPLAVTYPSIKNFITVLTQLADDELTMHQIGSRPFSNLNEAQFTVPNHNDGASIDYTFSTSSIPTQDVMKQIHNINAKLPNDLESEVGIFFNAEESVHKSSSIIRESSMNMILKHFRITCLRVKLFEWAGIVADSLKDDIISTSDKDTLSSSNWDLDQADPKVRESILQLDKCQHFVNYIRICQQQQCNEAREKIEHTKKLQHTIENVLSKKGNARIELERKIMKAGKRASVSAVERAHARHMEDIQEEQPLQDQKKESNMELRERKKFRTELEVELERISRLSIRIDKSKADFEKIAEIMKSSNRRVHDVPDRQAQLIANNREIQNEVIKYVGLKASDWQRRKESWEKKKFLLSNAMLEYIPPQQDRLRIILLSLVKQSLCRDMQQVGEDEIRRRIVAEETAAELAKQNEEELVRAEEHRLHKLKIKEAKVREREERRLQAQQELEAQRHREATLRRKEAEIREIERLKQEEAVAAEALAREERRLLALNIEASLQFEAEVTECTTIKSQRLPKAHSSKKTSENVLKPLPSSESNSKKIQKNAVTQKILPTAIKNPSKAAKPVAPHLITEPAESTPSSWIKAMTASPKTPAQDNSSSKSVLMQNLPLPTTSSKETLVIPTNNDGDVHNPTVDPLSTRLVLQSNSEAASKYEDTDVSGESTTIVIQSEGEAVEENDGKSRTSNVSQTSPKIATSASQALNDENDSQSIHMHPSIDIVGADVVLPDTVIEVAQTVSDIKFGTFEDDSNECDIEDATKFDADSNNGTETLPENATDGVEKQLNSNTESTSVHVSQHIREDLSGKLSVDDDDGSVVDEDGQRSDVDTASNDSQGSSSDEKHAKATLPPQFGDQTAGHMRYYGNLNGAQMYIPPSYGHFNPNYPMMQYGYSHHEMSQHPMMNYGGGGPFHPPQDHQKNDFPAHGTDQNGDQLDSESYRQEDLLQQPFVPINFYQQQQQHQYYMTMQYQHMLQMNNQGYMPQQQQYFQTGQMGMQQNGNYQDSQEDTPLASE